MVTLAKSKKLSTLKPAHMSDTELVERYRADRETAVASTGTRYEVFNTSALLVLGEMRVREQAGVWFAKK